MEFSYGTVLKLPYPFTADAHGSADFRQSVSSVGLYAKEQLYDGALAVVEYGQHVIYGLRDTTLGVWDLSRDKCLHILVGHTGSVRSVALTMDSRHIVSGSDDKTLRVWELDTGQCLRTLQGHTDWVRSVVLTLDGRHIVSGSSDKTLRVWELIWDLEFP